MSEKKEIDVHMLWQELGAMAHPVTDDARIVIERLTSERNDMEKEIARLKGMLNIFAGFNYSSAEKIAIARRGFVEEQ